MIAFLERSSSSEDDNHDHEHEEGGRRSSSRNKSQLHSMCYPPTKVQRHSASHLHSPNKTQRTLPSRGTVHHLFSFSAPNPWAGRSLSANTKEESDTRMEGEEKINSPSPSSSPALRLRLYIQALARALHLYLQGLRSFLLYPHSHQQTPIAICFSSFWVVIRFHSHGPSVRSSPD